jgi:hypothetical protein
MQPGRRVREGGLCDVPAANSFAQRADGTLPDQNRNGEFTGQIRNDGAIDPPRPSDPQRNALNTGDADGSVPSPTFALPHFRTFALP